MHTHTPTDTHTHSHNTEAGSIGRTTGPACQLRHSLTPIDPEADLIGVHSIWAGTHTHTRTHARTHACTHTVET